MDNNKVKWIAVAVFVAAWALLPSFGSRATVDLLVFTALYAIAGLGVSFLLGQCGIVSLAQSVFYGIGAYTTAYGCLHLGWSQPVAMAVGMALSGIIAAVLGVPVLRLSGFFLALATLALAIIGHTLFVEWEWITGGTLGVGGIPPIRFLGWELNTPQRFYYFVWPVLLIVFALHYALLRSRHGFAMRAMRDAPSAALALGVPTATLKVQVFVLSAVLGSFAGSLFAHYVSFVSVDSFGVPQSINFLLIAVLGGAKTIAGTVLGALFVTVMPGLLSRFGDFHAVLFALLLVLTVIFLPGGFGGLIHDLWRRHAGRRAPAKAAAASAADGAKP
ncbi:branched-chain amino acid ABC transporter permease [Variovorax boronicumulans]|uniref:branched-chain amino acid ABC transporter permease n=1 Tax=Variovorax boronicumulans TaxID=436515 RepID=UPI001C5851FF